MGISETKNNNETAIYHPTESIVENANVKEYDELYKRSIKDREGFWAEQAENLEWYKKWDKVLDDSNKPFYKWFVGAKTNIIQNAIDRHLKTWRRNKIAFIWEGEPGDVKVFSYHALNREVTKFANILKSNEESVALFEKAGFIKCAEKKQWIRREDSFEDEWMYQIIL